MKISTQAKLISTALVIVAIAAPIAQGESYGMLLSGSHPQLKTGEGFSFKAPSYWNAAPSYWRTVEGTLVTRTPRASVNRSLGVPAKYLGGGTQSVPGTPRASVNRSLGVPAKYLGGGAQSVPGTARASVNRSLGVPPQYLGSTAEQVSTASSGFNWLDAGVGAAFVASLGMIGLAVFVAMRRRNSLAQLEV
jgi:hypothetical protein